MLLLLTGDAFRFLTLASHGGLLFSLALASSVARRSSGEPGRHRVDRRRRVSRGGNVLV